MSKPYKFRVPKPSVKEEQKFLDFIDKLSAYSDNVDYDRNYTKFDIEITMMPYEEIDLKALRTFVKQGY